MDLPRFQNKRLIYTYINTYISTNVILAERNFYIGCSFHKNVISHEDPRARYTIANESIRTFTQRRRILPVPSAKPESRTSSAFDRLPLALADVTDSGLDKSVTRTGSADSSVPLTRNDRYDQPVDS